MSQVLTLEYLLAQEAEHRFETLDFDAAWTIGGLIRDRAAQISAPVAIEVYAFGQVLFVSALPGSTADNLEWMRRKRNTVLRLGHSSMFAGLNYETSGQRMEQQNYIDHREYTDHGGSFPLLLKNGAIIGAVSVSGLPSHEDHALVVWGISQYLPRQ